MKIIREVRTNKEFTFIIDDEDNFSGSPEKYNHLLQLDVASFPQHTFFLVFLYQSRLTRTLRSITQSPRKKFDLIFFQVLYNFFISPYNRHNALILISKTLKKSIHSHGFPNPESICKPDPVSYATLSLKYAIHIFPALSSKF